MLPRWPGAADAIRSTWTARVHRAARRRGGGVAGRGSGAAASDAGDWISPQYHSHAACAPRGGTPQKGGQGGGGAQQPAMPVIGFLRSTTAAPFAHLVVELGKGLSEEGFVEGRLRSTRRNPPAKRGCIPVSTNTKPTRRPTRMAV